MKSFLEYKENYTLFFPRLVTPLCSETVSKIEHVKTFMSFIWNYSEKKINVENCCLSVHLIWLHKTFKLLLLYSC